MRLVILSEVLALLIFAGACSQYNENKKAEAEEHAAQAEKIQKEEGDDALEKMHLPKTKERVEEVARLTPTPTAPPSLLNRHVDPAGDPQN